jgi:pimeloyl-ACP methyl ester carboxylesterase
MVVGGPPQATIVLLHGIFTSGGSWTPLINDLSRAHRVVTIDLPGHGALAAEPFILERAAQHVAATVRELGGDPPVLVGWSLGGLVAMEVLATEPGLARGLVLTGASFEPGRFLRSPMKLGLALLSHLPGAFANGVGRLVSRILLGRTVAEALFSGGAYVPQGLAALAELPDSGFAERLAAFGGPVLILNGSRDLVARSGVRQFGRIPSVTCRTIRRAGHILPLQRRDEFSRELLRFSGDCLRPAG